MAEEVLPGVHHLELPTPGDRLDGINAYLFQDDGNALLVDTGFDTEASRKALLERFDAIGLKDGPDQVVTTHSHVDHTGLSTYLRREYDAEIAAHPADGLYAAGPYSREERLAGLRTWLELNGAPDSFLADLFDDSLLLPSLPAVTPKVHVDRRLTGGETIEVGRYTLEVRWTPGHAPGHLCLYEADHGVLLSGDHVLPNTTPTISMHPYNASDPLGDFVTSLIRTSNLETSLVLPGHGKPFEAVESRVSQVLTHHRERADEIRSIISATPKTGWEIAADVSWAIRAFQELGIENTSLAVLETLAHVEYLRCSGNVRKRFDNGRIEFVSGDYAGPDDRPNHRS